jgi:TusE/DsrC/DsvC family sulfur relay protein
LAVLTQQVGRLVEQQESQREFLREMNPIFREMMDAATTTLGSMESKGYFAFGKELLEVGRHVVEHYSAQDVRALGEAVVSILDTVRALTQPQVLRVAQDAAQVVQSAHNVEPLGLVGMVRATRNPDVQQGMAVLMDIMAHVGRAAQALETAKANSPAQQRRERLAQATQPRKKGALGIERAQARPPVASAPLPPPAACAVPAASPAPAAAVVDGVAFTADGHLVDAQAWSRELAQRLALTLGVDLTDAHWKVLSFCREDFLKTQVSPNVRRITQGTGLSTKDLYVLFPKAPARTAAKIAGVPKPAGCL